MDVGKFETTPVPFFATFWLPDRDGRVVHDSPLFCIEGVGPSSYCIDKMHAWVLGPLADFIASVFWFAIMSDCWNYNAFTWMTQEERQSLSLLRLRGEMWTYYHKRRRNDEEFRKKVSTIWNLTLKMLGKAVSPSLSCKASECSGLLDFAVELLENHLMHFREAGVDTRVHHEETVLPSFKLRFCCRSLKFASYWRS